MTPAHSRELIRLLLLAILVACFASSALAQVPPDDIRKSLERAVKSGAMQKTVCPAAPYGHPSGVIRFYQMRKCEPAWTRDGLIALKALSMVPLPAGNRISFLAPSGALLVVLSDLFVRLGLEVPSLLSENVQRLQDISPPYIRMRNPVDIWASATVRGVEFAYREGLEAVLRDPNIDATIPVLMLTKEVGVPSFNFLLDLRDKYPRKPILVTFSGDKDCMEQCKAYLEPRGMPTFVEIEYPFIALSILARCARALAREA